MENNESLKKEPSPIFKLATEEATAQLKELSEKMVDSNTLIASYTHQI